MSLHALEPPLILPAEILLTTMLCVDHFSHQKSDNLIAGLRMAPGCAQMTRTWIRYNKPKVASYTHAGMIMGLGLTGDLPSSPAH